MLVVDFPSIFSKQVDLVIILNSPPLSRLLEDVWNRTELKMCADGGANVLYNSFGTKLIPDMIIGDLDSLKPEIRDIWSNKKVKTTPTLTNVWRNLSP